MVGWLLRDGYDAEGEGINLTKNPLLLRKDRLFKSEKNDVLIDRSHNTIHSTKSTPIGVYKLNFPPF